MNKLRFLLSLITKDNDYQLEQAASGQSAAQQHGVELQILYANNDAITQSTQLLRAIQSDPSRPSAAKPTTFRPCVSPREFRCFPLAPTIERLAAFRAGNLLPFCPLEEAFFTFRVLPRPRLPRTARPACK
jgi:hypothetical protein